LTRQQALTRPQAFSVLALSLAASAVLLASQLTGWDGLCVSALDEAVYAGLALAADAGLCFLFLLRARPAPLGRVLAGQYLACICFILYFPASPHSWLFLLLSWILPASLYLGQPFGLAASSAGTALAFALRFLLVPPELLGQRPAGFREGLLFLLVPLLCALLASLASAYGREAARLRRTILDVTQVNLSYQDYTAVLEEKSAFDERMRLTRDIHDIVGYSLTNTIMMMEAAKVMVSKDPAEVPALLETARGNAEAALEQVRQALGEQRKRELRSAAGPNAIARVIKMFKTATSVDVDLDFGNYDWNLGDEESFALRHFIQEAMLNAFKHGKARSIRIRFWEADGGLVVSVGNDGLGAGELVEGIGISGMRERLEKLGGSLSYQDVADGFSISIHIPTGRPA
jgi:signal transduction histidine kinase